MSVALRNQYDMTLTIGGKNYGYQLWEDPNGNKHWNEGLAPLITPQQRITEFSYQHIPPEIDMPAAFESWSLGAGSTEFAATAPSQGGLSQITANIPKVYDYSSNIDASWGDRLYLSPARVPDALLTTQPTFFFNSDVYGLWCAAGVYLYKYSLTTATWVLKLTGSAVITSMAENNGVLYVSLQDVAYQYATDLVGTTWTVFTGGNLESQSAADLFTVRGNVLMAMYNEKAYVTINGQNGGTAWSAGTAIGNTSETSKSLVVANNKYWIFKTQGIYSWDGTTVSVLWLPQYIESTNGKSAYVWYDGNIYTVYGSRILAIDPFDTQAASLKFVYPPEGTDGHEEHNSLELKGTISQISGTFNDLVFTVSNFNGGVYIMKGDPKTEIYHTLAYVGDSTSVVPIPGPAGTTTANTACIAVGPGIMHSTNPCIATGAYLNTETGANSQHYILPKLNLMPDEDSSYKFAVTGSIYGPWISYGARSFNKFLNSGSILGTGITAGQNVVLSYQLDDDIATTTQLVSAIDYGITTERVTTSVPFYRLRYVVSMNAVSGLGALVWSGSVTSTFSTSGPILIGATLHATMNPPRRRMWKPLIELKLNNNLRDGGQDGQDVGALRTALYAAAEQRITMTDRENNTFIVRILDIQEQQIDFVSEGASESDVQVLQLSLAEITTLTSQLVGAKYGQARYSQGYIYA